MGSGAAGKCSSVTCERGGWGQPQGGRSAGLVLCWPWLHQRSFPSTQSPGRGGSSGEADVLLAASWEQTSLSSASGRAGGARLSAGRCCRVPGTASLSGCLSFWERRAVINYLPSAATRDTEQMTSHPHSSGSDPCLSFPAHCMGLLFSNSRASPERTRC